MSAGTPERALSASAQRVQDALDALGVPTRVVEYADPGRTSADAARILGCEVAQIAKSLVFRGERSGCGVLVIASGANRVDEAKVAALLGEPVAKADARFVREATGFAIGGVPPVAHATPLRTFVDEDLTRFETLYAAGGSPHAMFPLSPRDLVRASGGRVGDVKLAAGGRPA